jgi:hypothetical protein
MALFLESHEGVRLSSRKPYRGDGDRKQPRNNHKNPKNTSAIKKKQSSNEVFSTGKDIIVTPDRLKVLLKLKACSHLTLNKS